MSERKKHVVEQVCTYIDRAHYHLGYPPRTGAHHLPVEELSHVGRGQVGVDVGDGVAAELARFVHAPKQEAAALPDGADEDDSGFFCDLVPSTNNGL